jgi:AcrR family transcriptional regulator
MPGTQDGDAVEHSQPPEMSAEDRDRVVDADAETVAGKAPASARLPLDRDRIVSTAVAYIDEFGLPGLTMRRLGSLLGVEAMSLYRYVPGREDLLDAVVTRIVDEMADDDEVLDAPRDGWQDFLQRLAHGIRRVALAHPKVFPLVASRPAEAPWLRPPLRDLRWVEAFLDGLVGEGFQEEDAVAAYRAFTSVLLGHLLLEVASLGADVGPLDVVDDGQDVDKSLADFPHVARLRSQLRQDHAALEFEDALEDLLNRIALIQSGH